MKKLFIAIATLVVLLPMGCNRSQQKTTPVVAMSAGTADINTLSFFIEAPNSELTAYLVQESAFSAPDAKTILEEGKTIDANTKIEETAAGLHSNTDYIIYAASSNGEYISEVQSLQMSTIADPSYFEDIKATKYTAWYSGLQKQIDADIFFIALANTDVNRYSAMPEGKGEMMWLYLIADKTNKENPVLAAGTYTMWDGATLPANGTFESEKSKFLMGSSASLEDWGMIGYKSGTIEVKCEDGVYSIIADMLIEDEEGEKKVKANYCGTLEFEDMTDGYAHFKEEQNITLHGGNAGLRAYENEGVNVTSSAFFTDGLLDEEGFIVSEGYLFCMDFVTAGNVEYSPVGTYSPNTHYLSDGKMEIGTYLPGMMYEFYGMIIPVYTTVVRYDTFGNILQIGLVEGGDVTLTNNGGKWQMHGALITNKGVKITVDFEGDEFPITDFRSNIGEPSRIFKSIYKSPIPTPMSVLR